MSLNLGKYQIKLTNRLDGKSTTIVVSDCHGEHYLVHNLKWLKDMIRRSPIDLELESVGRFSGKVSKIWNSVSGLYQSPPMMEESKSCMATVDFAKVAKELEEKYGAPDLVRSMRELVGNMERVSREIKNEQKAESTLSPFATLDVLMEVLRHRRINYTFDISTNKPRVHINAGVNVHTFEAVCSGLLRFNKVISTEKELIEDLDNLLWT